MAEGPKEHAGEKIRRELFALAREERTLRREVGNRILNGESVDDLRIQRRELRESQEDLSCAIVQLEVASL